MATKKRAIRAYKSLVKRHPKDALAPNALYRAAQLQEQTNNYTPAADYISRWLKDIPAARISTTPLRDSSASVRFI